MAQIEAKHGQTFILCKHIPVLNAGCTSRPCHHVLGMENHGPPWPVHGATRRNAPRIKHGENGVGEGAIVPAATWLLSQNLRPEHDGDEEG